MENIGRVLQAEGWDWGFEDEGSGRNLFADHSKTKTKNKHTPRHMGGCQN